MSTVRRQRAHSACETAAGGIYTRAAHMQGTLTLRAFELRAAGRRGLQRSPRADTHSLSSRNRHRDLIGSTELIIPHIPRQHTSQPHLTRPPRAELCAQVRDLLLERLTHA